MNNLEAREYILEDSVKKLEAVNKKIAKLTLEKEALTQEIIAALGHEKEGQRTYEVDIWKVTCSTPYIYSLDKNAYKNGDIFIDDDFNPIKESVSYTVDKRLYEQYYNTAPKHVREALTQLITVKPGKPSVKVGTL